MAPPLLAEAGRARRIHDRLASCFYSTVFSTCTSAIVSSSLGPPAARNESTHIYYGAPRALPIAPFGSILASHHSFCYSLAPGNLGNDVCAFLIPGNEKTGPGMKTLTAHLDRQLNDQ